MCRRRKRDRPTRHEFLPKKLAAHRAPHEPAIRRQRSHPLFSIPFASRPPSLESARAAARATVDPGARGISGGAHRWRDEIPACPESGRRRNSRAPSRAVLLRGPFRLAFFAIVDRRRYFAHGDGSANEPQQSRSSAGQPGGSDHRLHVVGAAGRVRFALGARSA